MFFVGMVIMQRFVIYKESDYCEPLSTGWLTDNYSK
jgi:hypothetical protein